MTREELHTAAIQASYFSRYIAVAHGISDAGGDPSSYQLMAVDDLKKVAAAFGYDLIERKPAPSNVVAL